MTGLGQSKMTGLDQSKMISLGQMKTTGISPEPTEDDILDADLINPVIRPSFAGHDDLLSIRRLYISLSLTNKRQSCFHHQDAPSNGHLNGSQK